MRRLTFLYMLSVVVILLLPMEASAQDETTQDSIVELVPRGDEVFRWGYSELQTESSRALYDTILGSLIRFEPNNASPYYYHRCNLAGVPNTMSIQDVIAWLGKLSYDIPELYILSSTIPRYDANIYYARIGYVNRPERYLSELQQLQAIADTLLVDCTQGMSDYERLLILHDRFIEWGDYGDLTGADAGNIRGALINRRAVCEGFARAGLYLCQRVGIPCIFVTGQLQTSSLNDTWGNHAWNFVQLDGNWYLMDLTGDGGFPGIVGHDAFLRGADYFTEHYRFCAPGGINPNTNGIYQSLPSLATSDYSSAVTVLEDMPWTSRISKRFVNGQLYLSTDSGVFNLLGERIK